VKVEKWKRYCYSRETMEKLVIPNFEKLERDGVYEADRLVLCGRFVYAADCQGCHSKHFAGYSKCRSRWCINCNHVRALAWVARLIPILEDYIDKGNYITKMNLTIKDQAELKPMVLGLQESWRAFTNGNGARERWKERFPGGLRSLEVKRGKNSKLWHPHYHCIGLQESYEIDYPWIKERWKEVTFNQFGAEGSVWLKGHDRKEGLLKAVIETVKYIMDPDKGIFVNSDHLLEAYITLKGRRQINTWGILRKQLREEDIEAEAMADDSEKKLTDFICQRCGCTEAELKGMLFSQTPTVLLDYSKEESFFKS
jgi:hypothetical protein